MKLKLQLIFLIPVSLAITAGASAAIFTNSPDANAFVRASAPTANYGGAGSLSVSGASATNASGVANGAFDTFIRFNNGTMVSNFNAAFGSNNWLISGATLQVTEVGAPNNAIFNHGVGAFQIRWIANDNWTQGSGTPSLPGSSGITYSEESTLLNSATDASLGTFTNSGANSALSFALGLPASFVNNLIAGGEVGLFLTAIDPGIGFTFNSQNFGTASARPYLMVSAVSGGIARPGIASLNLSVSNIVIAVTNAAAGTTYSVLAGTNAAVPANQWSSLTSITPSASGNFSITLSNAPAPAGQQFFLLRAQ